MGHNTTNWWVVIFFQNRWHFLSECKFKSLWLLFHWKLSLYFYIFLFINKQSLWVNTFDHNGLSELFRIQCWFFSGQNGSHRSMGPFVLSPRSVGLCWSVQLGAAIRPCPNIILGYSPASGTPSSPMCHPRLHQLEYLYGHSQSTGVTLVHVNMRNGSRFHLVCVVWGGILRNDKQGEHSPATAKRLWWLLFP